MSYGEFAVAGSMGLFGIAYIHQEGTRKVGEPGVCGWAILSGFIKNEIVYFMR